MQEKLPSFGVSLPSAARLDDLCSSTADIKPPTKPIRQVTGEYKRGGIAIMSPSKSRFLQLPLSYVDWAITSLDESPDIKPCKPVRSSSAKRPQSALLSVNNGTQAELTESLSSCLTNDLSSYTLDENSTSAFFLNGIKSPIIARAMVHSAKFFFGAESNKKVSLMDDDDNDSRSVPRALFVSDGSDGDISDVEDDMIADETSRWLHSSSRSLDRISASTISMPSKPQRRASLLQTFWC